MRVSIISAAALAFGVSHASIQVPSVPDVSLCAEESSEAPPSVTPSASVTQWTTSTVLSTSVVTITKCPPTVKHCPAESVVVTTVVVPVSTTVCPVTEEAPKPTWTTQQHDIPSVPHGTGAPPVFTAPPAPPVWSSGTLPSKPAPTKPAPVTAGAGRAAVPAMGLVALVAALL